MTPPHICPECGSPLPPDAPAGLCPKCLLGEALQPGERVQYFGNYELLEEIALGGMGIVWKARQTSLNRVVALKMIRGGVLASAEDVRRFLAEAEAAANLQHPNIVAIHEVGEHEGQHYFSMDFVDGKNLAELCEGQPLAPARAAELLATIADAVQFAHQRGILHRDLKPQNVMIDATGAPRLTDFGLAKRLDVDSSFTQTGAILGSPSYMAPEQAQGRLDRIGTPTDVYSLGAILYEMLTARAPFRGESPAETLIRVINDEPVAPSKLEAQVPRDLETICLKCLEKDPVRRYPTARELAEDVRRFLSDEPILARPVSPLRKAENWFRRHPWTVTGVASAVVLVLAFLVDLLVEQNNFLRNQHLFPGLTRAPGPRTAELQTVGSFASFVYLVVLWMQLAVLKQARRLTSWAQVFEPQTHWKPLGAISPRLAAIASLIALAGAAYGLILLHKCIEVFVWEGQVHFFHALMLFPVFWFSLSLLTQALRSTRGGTSLLSLSPEALPDVEASIREGEMAEAIKRVRAAAPNASLADARDTVERIAARLEAVTPGTLIAPHTRRAINWKALGICAAGEAFAFAILWVTLPPAQPVPFLWDLAAGFLLGSGLLWGVRQSGFWRRMLALLPFLAVLIAADIFVKPHYPGFQFQRAAFMSGTLFGAILLLSAWHRPARAPERGNQPA